MNKWEDWPPERQNPGRIYIQGLEKGGDRPPGNIFMLIANKLYAEHVVKEQKKAKKEAKMMRKAKSLMKSSKIASSKNHAQGQYMSSLGSSSFTPKKAANTEMAQKFFGKSANIVNLKMQDMSIFSDEIGSDGKKIEKTHDSTQGTSNLTAINIGKNFSSVQQRTRN